MQLDGEAPAVLLICKPSTGKGLSSDLAGGAVTVGEPMASSAQFTLVKSCSPVSAPLWPRVGLLWICPAAATQASCSASVNWSYAAACVARFCRMTNCAPVRGFRGVTSVLRSSPLRPFQLTVSPSFPVCGMSLIFILSSLSVVVCCYGTARLAPADHPNCARRKTVES